MRAQAFLAYLTSDRSSNGDTEAINGLIELHRRVTRGFRNCNNYRLRMLLGGSGLSQQPPTQARKATSRAKPS